MCSDQAFEMGTGQVSHSFGTEPGNRNGSHALSRRNSLRNHREQVPGAQGSWGVGLRSSPPGPSPAPSGVLGRV